MTTIEAFMELSSKRKWYEALGIPEKTANTMRKRVRDQEKISVEKIEEVLMKAGFEVVQEKMWEKKPSAGSVNEKTYLQTIDGIDLETAKNYLKNQWAKVPVLPDRVIKEYYYIMIESQK